MEERKEILLSEATFKEIDEELQRRMLDNNSRERLERSVVLLLLSELIKNLMMECEKQKPVLRLKDIQEYAKTLESISNIMSIT